jgi:hypothetical protein
MTDATIAHSEPVLVAIDIAKARHEVLIAVPGKRRRRRLTVLNQLDDFDRLITTLSEYDRPVRAAPVDRLSAERQLSPRSGLSAWCCRFRREAGVFGRISPHERSLEQQLRQE